MSEIVKTILNEDGLHARPAGQMAKIAAGSKSTVEILFNGKTINAKSSMSLMALSLRKGSEITIRADGPDAVDVLHKIGTLIDNQFQV